MLEQFPDVVNRCFGLAASRDINFGVTDCEPFRTIGASDTLRHRHTR